MRLTLPFHQFTYKFKKKRKNAKRNCREISKLKKKSLDGGKLWYLDSGFAILQDTRVVYKMQQAEKCWRGWHEVNSFIPPLNYHRSTWKDGNFLGELPSFHGSFLLFLCPWFRNTRHAFSTAISPCLYKGAFCIHLHDNVVSHANVVCSCLACTCIAYARG